MDCHGVHSIVTAKIILVKIMRQLIFQRHEGVRDGIKVQGTNFPFIFCNLGTYIFKQYNARPGVNKCNINKCNMNLFRSGGKCGVISWHVAIRTITFQKARITRIVPNIKRLCYIGPGAGGIKIR